ncbi:hypothetical protein [Cupriavidus basilensis]|uniref:hypothetical protein n=1 Tax=Cupriavidus basilensis TaxID=68895 RepID=UPI0028457002|nr:hypothetical protein [Cupriavidus basilensis]MDR3382331.1 hypothetical protein [Cupriavidus basilensis]
MNKGEVEVHKGAIRAQNVRGYLDLAKHALSMLTVLLAIYLVMNGALQIVKASPEQIGAIAKVLEAIKLADIAGWIVGGIGVGAWRLERTGKKRAYKKLATLRREVEADDSYNAGSGLTVAGDTPKKRRA